MLAVVFPFDLFGSAGTGPGALLLGDALQEMLDDANEETQPARAESYRDQLSIEEFTFETLEECNQWRTTATEAVRSAFKEKKRLLWIAGNHLGVLPIYEELGPKSLVIQFDAHLDIYNLSDSTTELSHGNYLLHAKGPIPSIAHVGSRDLFLPEEHSRNYFRYQAPAEQVASDPDRVIREIASLAAKAKQIWIDIDCDVFDPAYFPAVQHPQPFGLSPAFVLRVLSAIWSDKVAGVSISEFDPGRDRNDQSLATLIWLVEWCLLMWSEPK
ncbi:MAG: hypothetical protein EXS09_06120 [Gemmataceae bacterium]|nr:hypothetical protein [Gemmataceae bacterium]